MIITGNLFPPSTKREKTRVHIQIFFNFCFLIFLGDSQCDEQWHTCDVEEIVQNLFF